jgi:hypothetical protein
MTEEIVFELSLPLYYLMSHCDSTSPACLDVFLHVLNQQELKAATLSDASLNVNGSVGIKCHICDVWEYGTMCASLTLCKTQENETWNL